MLTQKIGLTCGLTQKIGLTQKNPLVNPIFWVTPLPD